MVPKLYPTIDFKFFRDARALVVTSVSVPEVMALVMREVTEELVETTLAPDCADSLQLVLAVLVDEEAFTLLVLEPNKARILPCTVELFSAQVPDTLSSSSVDNSAASVESSDSGWKLCWRRFRIVCYYGSFFY